MSNINNNTQPTRPNQTSIIPTQAGSMELFEALAEKFKRDGEKRQAKQQQLREEHNALLKLVKDDDVACQVLTKDLLFSNNDMNSKRAEIENNAFTSASSTNEWKEQLSKQFTERPPIDGKWKIMSLLAEGQNSFVFEATDISSGSAVAVKIERLGRRISTVDFEKDVYQMLRLQRLQTTGNVGSNTLTPKVHYCGKLVQYNIIVISRLGPSLKNLLESYPKGMPVKWVLRIGLQLVDRIEELHGTTLMHGNIKPSNILTAMDGSGTYHLIDFSLAWFYVDPLSKEHIPEQRIGGFQGSFEYASIQAHSERSLDRASDLESLAYVLIHLMKGTLPWLQMTNPPVQEGYIRMKAGIASSKFMRCLPNEMIDFLKESMNLKYGVKPAYNRLRWLLRKAIEQLDKTESRYQSSSACEIPRTAAQNRNSLP